MKVAVVIAAALAAAQAADPRGSVGDRVMRLTRDSAWTLVAATPVHFRTFHPQGMVRIGDALFVSSVEVTVPTRRLANPVDGMDRDAGQGIGHLFKLDLRGNLLSDLRLGEGAIYHPGGIDFDGTSLWVPLAEYRPDSRSIIYRVDPNAMKANEAGRVRDHIGALVRDSDSGSLYGVSWGSRRFYRWPLDRDGRVADASTAAPTVNGSHYVDYQDCKYAGQRRMLCGGVAELSAVADARRFWLGGLELVSLADGRPLHQVPMPLWTAGGLPMTQNPVWIEPSATGLRAYFMPEDDQSTLYIYDVDTSRR